MTKPQVIVTGVPISIDLANSVRSWCADNLLFAVDWCHTNGTIGYLDIANAEIDAKGLRAQLQNLAQKFPILDLGVSLMTGPPGSYNQHVVTYKVKNKKVSIDVLAHVGHPPPTRMKKTVSS